VRHFRARCLTRRSTTLGGGPPLSVIARPAHNVSYVTTVPCGPAPVNRGYAEPPGPGNMYIRFDLVSLFLWVSAAVCLCAGLVCCVRDQPSLRGR